jgi:hypothetical protein
MKKRFDQFRIFPLPALDVLERVTSRRNARLLTRLFLTLAGCNNVVTLDELMGQSLARRTVAGDAIAHVIGQMDDLVIAEATATGTPLVDKKLEETDVRNLTGVTVVGVWEHGQFRTAAPDTRIHRQTVHVLAGSHQQIEMYNELFCIYNVSSAPVIILGGGTWAGQWPVPFRNVSWITVSSSVPPIQRSIRRT